MPFVKAQPCLVKQLDPRWTSGVWEVGLHRAMFGYKVRAGHIDNHCTCHIDLHVGNDPTIINRTLLAVIWIIEAYERDAQQQHTYDLREFIPDWSCWPVNQDRQCWDYLCRIAAETHVTQSGLTAASYLRTTVTSGQSQNWHNRYGY